MYDFAGEALEGNYYSNHWHQDSTNDASRLFVQRYKDLGREFGPGNALSEDCVFLFIDAIKRANSLDPEQIRIAIASTKSFTGVTGNIHFDDNGDPIKSAVIMKFGSHKSVYLKTIEP